MLFCLAVVVGFFFSLPVPVIFVLCMGESTLVFCVSRATIQFLFDDFVIHELCEKRSRFGPL